MMIEIQCSKHSLSLKIPTMDKEFLVHGVHENIIALKQHHEEFPNCKFEEVQES